MIESNVDLKIPRHETQVAWALELVRMGMAVIPTYPQRKMPAIKWKDSPGLLTAEEILNHWSLHPDHESAILPGGSLAVLDADSKEAIMALTSLEFKHGMKPSIIVATSKGEHHYYRIEEGVKASAESHSTDLHPERIDVRTGRNPAMGPGSCNKRIVTWNAASFDELSPASQAFLDDVRAHNGHVERAQRSEAGDPDTPQIRYQVDQLAALLEFIDPDDYPQWTSVGMALHRETSGSAEGSALYDTWSRKSEKYPGIRVIESKWRSFEGGHSNPVTIGTLKHLAREGGADLSKIFNTAPRFASVVSKPVERSKQETIVQLREPGLSATIAEDVLKQSPSLSKVPRLARHSLTHRIDEVERLVLDEKLICGGLVAMGETTLISAEPNTGKTALALRLLVNSIRDGSLDPKKLIYVNLDDSSRGLFEKLKLACEYGFEMLAPVLGFRASDTIPELEEMISDGTAHGSVVVIDTVTRLFDNNSKVETREFTDVSRRFSGQGGTMLLLGHCNKHRNKAGKLDYAGVSDLPNDVDCRYILDTIHVDKAGGFKVVGFENGKRRSSVKQTAAFKYSTREAQSYEELLLSVDEVNPEDYFLLGGSAAATEKEAVEVVVEILRAGPQTRMKLAVAIGEKVDLSRVKIFALLDKYGNADSGLQRWTVTKEKKNNAMTYKLLEEAGKPGPAPVSRFSGSPVHQAATTPAHPHAAEDQVPYSFEDEENEEFEDVKF